MADRRYSLTRKDDLHTTHLPVVRTADEISTQTIKLSEQKREGFLARFFPNETQRAIIKGELAQVQTEYEFRKRALEMLRETQLQNLTETCNQYLIRDKASRRADTTKFLLQEKEKLSDELDIRFNRFMKKLADKYQDIEKETNPLFRQIRQDNLDKEINDFMELKNKLVDKFQCLVDEGV